MFYRRDAEVTQSFAVISLRFFALSLRLCGKKILSALLLVPSIFAIFRNSVHPPTDRRSKARRFRSNAYKPSIARDDERDD